MWASCKFTSLDILMGFWQMLQLYLSRGTCSFWLILQLLWSGGTKKLQLSGPGIYGPLANVAT